MCGCNTRLELNPPLDVVARLIFDMALQGHSVLDIVKTLNADGIPNPTGRPWSKNGVHIILRNEAYTGTLLWGGGAKDKGDPVRVEKAFPGLISKTQFRRVNRQMRSRAPRQAHPRRVSSSYLLSGLAKCETCGKALSASEAKSGKYTYYVCQSILKLGKDACHTPRLNAKNFEDTIISNIRENILTESNIRELVKLLDEEMDGVAREQRHNLETVEAELEEVKRKLARIWQFVESTDIEMADAADRIKEHRERQAQLEDAAQEARAELAARRGMLDSADTIAAFAEEMGEFLKTSELTETRAFVRSFVKKVQVKPGLAAIIYTIPTPEDSPIGRTDAEEMALHSPVLSTVKSGGPECTVLRTFRWEVLL